MTNQTLHGVLQDSSPNAQSEAASAATNDLPQYAVWRFGDYGRLTESNGIYRLEFSRDGKLLATRNRENSVAIYDVQKQTQICEVSGHENSWVTSIDFSPDAEFFMTAAGSSEKVKIWNTQTGKLESEIDTDATAAYFDDAGDAIHVFGETHVETYSWPGVQMTTQRKWKTEKLTRAGMSRDGRLVVAYRSLNPQIYQSLVIDLESKSKVTLDGTTAIPKSVVFSPNNLWVAVVHQRDPRVRLWDLRDPGNKKYTLAKHNETVQSISISPDNRFLISSSWDGNVVAWDLLSREPIGLFEGHTQHVNATAFSPVDFIFASGASGVNDCSTILWNMRDLVIPEVPDPKPEDFDPIWSRLGTTSLKISLRATAEFIKGGEMFLDPLEERIKSSVMTSSSGTFDENIRLLTHPEYVVRERATEDLIRVRVQAEPRLRRVLVESTDPELRYRIGRILKTKIARSTTSVVDLRRWGRIIFALEQINSTHSQKILESIADGHRDVDVAEDARDSFERNERRNKLPSDTAS
jgi:WD40 repeat protein